MAVTNFDSSNVNINKNLAASATYDLKAAHAATPGLELVTLSLYR